MHALNRQMLARMAGTSLLSKAATAAVQMFSVPLVIIWLGKTGFAEYATLTYTCGLLSLASLGFPQAVSISVAHLHARKRTGEIWSVTSAAVTSSLLLATLASFILLGGVFTFGLQAISPVLKSDTRAWAAVIELLLLACASAVLNVIESAQTACLEQDLQNVAYAIGSLLVFFCVSLGRFVAPSITIAVLILQAPLILIRAVNALWFILRWRRVGQAGVATRPLRSGVFAGCGYFVVSLGSYFNHQFVISQAGRTIDASSTINLVALLTVYTSGFGFVSMITTPVMPIIATCFESGDRLAVTRLSRRLRLYGIAVGATALAVLPVFGPSAIHIWMHKQATPDQYMCALLGFYFFLCVWEHVHYQILIALRATWSPAAWFAARSAIMLLISPAVMTHFGVSGLLIGMSLTTTFLTCIPYTLRVIRTTRRLNSHISAVKHPLRTSAAQPSAIPDIATTCEPVRL